MAKPRIDLQKEVVRRVQNAVHSLKKELETAGVDVSAVVVEETADGINVRVEKPVRKSVRKAAVETPPPSPLPDASGRGDEIDGGEENGEEQV